MTNHMGSISYHIMPLVIDSLGGGHARKHTNTYERQHRNNFKKLGMRRPANEFLLMMSCMPNGQMHMIINKPADKIINKCNLIAVY